MLKRRSSDDMNPRMAAILGTFQILWVIYGVLIGSRNITTWNLIAIITNYLTVGAYAYFRRGDGDRDHAQRRLGAVSKRGQ
jgi:MtN3 and saliva related transmembrane protein